MENLNEVNVIKDIEDTRGLADIGSGLFIKRGGESKYHLWIPVTGMGATGSDPETLDGTVTTGRSKTAIKGRIDPGTYKFTFLAHRDNYAILEQDYGRKRDFLLVNPDGTGFKFQGEVSYYQDEISVGNAIKGSGTIVVSKSSRLPILNVLDLIQETVTFESTIDSVISITGTGTQSITVETDPEDATITAESDTTGVATATISNGVLTITGVAKGNAIIKLTVKSTDCADGVTHILVIVN